MTLLNVVLATGGVAVEKLGFGSCKTSLLSIFAHVNCLSKT